MGISSETPSTIESDLFLAAHHEAAHITVLRHYLPDSQAAAFLWINENAQDESERTILGTVKILQSELVELTPKQRRMVGLAGHCAEIFSERLNIKEDELCNELMGLLVFSPQIMSESDRQLCKDADSDDCMDIAKYTIANWEAIAEHAQALMRTINRTSE